MGSDLGSEAGPDELFLQATLPVVDLVHNLARRLTDTRADAEDLVQETFTRAWAAWADGRRPDRTPPWLATICLNLGRDRARRAATRVEEPSGDRLGESLDPPSLVDVEAEALARVDRTVIETAMRTLPYEQRVAVTLMDMCGFTAAEVATITQAPRGTVLARVHRGRKRLAHALQGVPRHAP